MKEPAIVNCCIILPNIYFLLKPSVTFIRAVREFIAYRAVHKGELDLNISVD